MAENQEEMSPTEMKVARQIEVVLTINYMLMFGKIWLIPALKISYSYL